MKAVNYSLIGVFILVSLFAANAQKGSEIIIKPGAYEKLKSSGKLNRDARYLMKIDKAGIANKLRLPVNEPVNTTSCGTLPALSFTDVSFQGSYEIDDGSSDPITLPFNFCFYGTNYTTVYINANGNITFGAGSLSFSSTGFPNSNDVMIAPFWSDVDIRGGNGHIRASVGSDYFAVTWDSVGYYSMMGDKRNTYTVIITNGSSSMLPAGNNVGFFYGDMNWTAGSASGGTNGLGGTPATAGVNKGDGSNFIQIGRFDSPGNIFYGNSAANNQVDWLDGKSFFFDLCGSSNNIAPIAVDHGYCDTVVVCGSNDTISLSAFFAAPEVNQITSITVSAPSLGSSFTTVTNDSGSTGHIVNQIITNAGLLGFHTITYTATDNGTPQLSTTIDITLNIIDQVAANPMLAISPSPVCYGDTVSATLLNPSDFQYFLWSNQNSDTTVTFNSSPIGITLTDTTGCQIYRQISIDTLTRPNPTVIGNLHLCDTTSATSLQLASPSGSEPSYSTITWMPGNFSGNSFSAIVGTYTVSVIGDNGCAGQKKFLVENNAIGNITFSNQNCYVADTTIQLNPSIQGAFLGNPCTLSTFNNLQEVLNNTVGNASATPNSSTGWPSPYGNWFMNSRHQFLILASELNALGVYSGSINSISFNVNALNGIGALPGFRIKIACTNLNTLPAQSSTSGDQFISGALQVYSNPSYNVILGTNTHVFDQAFIWDGTSNLIIETCFDQSSTYTYNASVSQSNTTFISTINAYADSYPVCTSPVSVNASFNNYTLRPDITFGITPNLDPTNFVYSWAPSSGLSASDIEQPYASLTSGSVTYSLLVTDTTYGCSTSNAITLNVDPSNPQVSLQPLSDTLCIGGGFNLNCAATGTINGYQWYKNNIQVNDGTNISGSTTASLAITSAQIADEGWYKCEIMGNCNTYTDSVYVQVNNCTAIKNYIGSGNVKLYPNPAGDRVFIEWSKDHKSAVSVEIYNSLGQKVFSVNVKDDSGMELNTTDLSEGIYNVVLIGPNSKETLKFIKLKN